MVSTRGHPKPLPDPATAIATATSTPTSPTTTPRRRNNNNNKTPSKSRSKARSKDESTHWTYVPHAPTLLWLLFSLPLVLWDTGYILFRPHTFPGGTLYWPMYVPYGKYGVVDLVYSRGAWESHMGFTAAQGFVNLLETAGYLAYLGVVLAYSGQAEVDAVEGEELEETGWTGKVARTFGFKGTAIGGGWGGVACLAGFAVCVMTISKTVLYFLNEVFSGWSYTGHNDAVTLFFFWILPNSLWIIFPAYIATIFARDILRGLAIASHNSSSAPAALVSKSE